MKLIIPMAGRGTRLRPHTHVTPKPLLPVVGVPMVERIVNTFTQVLPRPLSEGVFVLGDFPQEVNEQLTQICERHGMKASVVYQDIALGTGHAVDCARDFLEGEIIAVFADTVFTIDTAVSLEGADVVAFVKWVEDPRRFGVVVMTDDRITDFVEKPKEIISNDALIGIYYVKEGERLRGALKYIIENEVTGHGNEYQLTDAFDYMLKQGLVFRTAQVTDWLDCGTIEALMDTSRVLLNRPGEARMLGTIEESVIIQPVYMGEGAVVRRSIVGPNVVVEAGAQITDAIVRDSIVFSGARIQTAQLRDSLVGREATLSGHHYKVNVGDHSSAG
ncbi:MAG TPA: sugar phosphate nucleotidyltransferase [Rhodothermales bacterium]|nr:sugar phosphate nucleotidyltransferase [Rhodothermales bacterium]